MNNITEETPKISVIESKANINIEKPKTTTKSPTKRKTSTKISEKNIYIMKTVQKNRRINIMVIGAACGLVFCLLMLTTYKNDLPGEIVGIVSTIAGIFGACLKDAYSSEFGSSVKKDVPLEKKK